MPSEKTWAESFKELMAVKIADPTSPLSKSRVLDLLIDTVGAELDAMDLRIASLEHPCDHEPWRPTWAEKGWHLLILPGGQGERSNLDLCKHCNTIYPAIPE